MSTSKAEKNSSTEVKYARPMCEWTVFDTGPGDDVEQGGLSDGADSNVDDDGAGEWDGEIDLDPQWCDEEDDETDQKEKVPVNGRFLVIFDVNGVLLKRKEHDRREFTPRPYLDQLLKMLDRQSARIIPAVWSSMMKKNLAPLVRELFGERRRNLGFIWDQTWCTEKHMPGLGKKLLRKDLVWLKSSRYSDFYPDHVVLIDDDAHKCTANPEGTAIHPSTFNGRRDDRELMELGRYLERIAATKCDSTKDFVKQWPYKKSGSGETARPQRPLAPGSDIGAPPDGGRPLAPGSNIRPPPSCEESEPEPKRVRSASVAAPAAEPAAKQAPAEVPAAPVAAARTPPEILAQPREEDSWRRMESKSAPGVFYYYNSVTGESKSQPPAPWQKRESRSAPGTFYYWNPQTGQTSYEKPEV